MTRTGPRLRRYHRKEPPISPEFVAAVEAALKAVAPIRRDKALPLLQHIQARLGYLPAAALAEASRQSRIPLAELNALVSFYDLLCPETRRAFPETRAAASGQQPGAKLYRCDDLVCRSASVKPVLPTAGQVQHVPCLGQCDRGPAALAIAPGQGAIAYGGYSRWQLYGTGETKIGWPPGYSPLLLGRSDGPEALERARAMSPQELVALVKRSKLAGRGGAAFPTGIKWEAVLNAPTPPGHGPDGAQKYVVVNADESEPGAFTNRVLLESDPVGVICSALIAAHAVGASQVYIYIRGEYPHATDQLTAATRELQPRLGGIAVEIRSGSGAYVCGEETALFASIEGERGEPRNKPPFPTSCGLFDRPTLVNNAETLYNLLPLLIQGSLAYNAVQPKLFSVSGHVVSPGVYEVPLSTPLRDLIDLAGGPAGELQAVLMGGAAGMFLGPNALDTPLDVPSMAAAGTTLGSGAVMLFNCDTDLWDIARRAARFFAAESCGKCPPCRIGTARQLDLVERLAGGEHQWLPLHRELGEVMADASICGLGQSATNLVRSLLSLKGVTTCADR